MRLHRAYRVLRSEIDRLVGSVPGASPRADGPEPTHPWEAQLQGLERVLRDFPEVPAPLPRWAGLEARERQDNANAIERRRRSGGLSADEQAALAIGRAVTIK